MSNSFIKFNDEIIDSNVMMELTDLTRLLFKDKDVSVSVRKFSYFNPKNNTMNVSNFWKHRHDISELEGFRHDILTRFPSPGIFDYAAFETLQETSLLFKQIFLSIEHYRNRLESFSQRRLAKTLIKRDDEILSNEYRKLSKNEAEQILKDLNIAILNNAENVNVHRKQFNIISHSTMESISIANAIYNAIDDKKFYKHQQIHEMPFNDIVEYNHTTPYRKDSSELTSSQREESDEDTSRVDTKTGRDAEAANVIGEAGEDNTSKKSDHNLENPYDDDVSDFTEGFGTNKGDNRLKDRSPSNNNAELIVKKPKLNLKYYNKYKQIYDSYNDLAQKVIGDITKLLKYKMDALQTGRSSGKLMKNPVSPIINGSHKLFTKKNVESKEIDAVFSLVLDQSFSMADHLDECVDGIIIINNILKSLGIPHRITSHHEDSVQIISNQYPNYIYEHMTFGNSQYYYPVSLLDIEASGDNRDGFVFRHETDILNKRPEKDKFLIIFSDGLPSAEQYNQTGVVDTHQAVNEAKKRGINVINIFIDHENDENTRMAIKNIYGQNTVIIRNVKEIAVILPDVFERIIKTLLL
ncbi:hypothetical protein [Salinicoccus albus]|uniref:hypothetical protein n=1 Tax=Salinicoccus albus TaxID=418756 RepID=UPI00037796EE|nr:hypothetical protein [Salinicoccus albus]